jgi:hypothetical protein
MKRALFIAVAMIATGTVHASCGSAFCMVNTNWNLQGWDAEPGLRLDLRYEYVKQDQPMTGTRKLAIGEIPRHHDEVRTINRNLLGSLDYTISDRWGVTATVPVVDRYHLHIHNHQGGRLVEDWNFQRLGDVRILGRYQLTGEDAQNQRLSFYGANFGLKLPTGERDVRNADGERAERTLQPGTGTTDALVGGYYSRVMPAADSSWFVQGLLQAPLNGKEDYRPGKRVTVDVGYRYELSEKVGLMAQLNVLVRGRDTGNQAEPEDTGGRFFYISPGASYSISKNVQVYGFLQLPIYQHVNGVQLTADWSALGGISFRF